MAYPVSQQTASFNKNVHDAFGVDTGGRKLPHTGIDFAGSGPVYSVCGGNVIWSGYDTEAGWSVVIQENDGLFRGYAHMASAPLFKVGDWVATGGRIGTIGASGTGAKGAHLHHWAARTAAAAIRILTGYINYKGSQSTKQWADSMGLVDPMPSIEASLRGTETKPDPTTEEDDMAQVPQEEWTAVRAQIKAIRDEQTEEDGIAQKTLAAVQNNYALLGKIWDRLNEVRDGQLAPGKRWTLDQELLGIVRQMAANPTQAVDVSALAAELSKQDIQVQAIIPEESLAAIEKAAREGGAEAVEALEFVTVVKR